MTIWFPHAQKPRIRDSRKLGFAMHTISQDGEVKTEFVALGTQP